MKQEARRGWGGKGLWPTERPTQTDKADTQTHRQTTSETDSRKSHTACVPVFVCVRCVCIVCVCARGGGGACVFGSAGHLEGGPDGLAAGDAAEQAALEDQEERLDVPGGPLGDARKRRQGRGRHGWAESNNHKGGMGWGGVEGAVCVGGRQHPEAITALVLGAHARTHTRGMHASKRARTDALTNKCALAQMRTSARTRRAWSLSFTTHTLAHNRIHSHQHTQNTPSLLPPPSPPPPPIPPLSPLSFSPPGPPLSPTAPSPPSPGPRLPTRLGLHTSSPSSRSTLACPRR